MAKTAVSELLESQKLISRKIWVMEKSWNFHTVFWQLTNFVRLGLEWSPCELRKGRTFSYEANFHKYKHRSSIWTGEAWKYANFQGSEFGCCYLGCYRTYKGRFCGLQDWRGVSGLNIAYICGPLANSKRCKAYMPICSLVRGSVNYVMRLIIAGRLSDLGRWRPFWKYPWMNLWLRVCCDYYDFPFGLYYNLPFDTWRILWRLANFRKYTLHISTWGWLHPRLRGTSQPLLRAAQPPLCDGTACFLILWKTVEICNLWRKIF